MRVRWLQCQPDVVFNTQMSLRPGALPPGLSLHFLLDPLQSTCTSLKKNTRCANRRTPKASTKGGHGLLRKTLGRVWPPFDHPNIVETSGSLICFSISCCSYFTQQDGLEQAHNWLVLFESTGQALASESSRKTARPWVVVTKILVVVHWKHGRYEIARVTLCLSRLPFVEDMVLPWWAYATVSQTANSA